MSKNLLSRYIWIIDTIRRHGTITRERLNELWMRSPYSDGNPLPRRTFFNYRNAIEELFKISIECNTSTFEYSINDGDPHNESVTDWMLNSAAMSNVLTDAHDVSHRIFLEDVPSSRLHLDAVIDALKTNRPIRFTYSPYNRSLPTRNVVVEPYFLKIFKQRWYATGRNVKDNQIKTYALDRMTEVSIEPDDFNLPDDFDAEEYVRDSFGIIFSQGEAKQVAISTDSRQAKYFRALPLHHSQTEMVHDTFSIFNYKLKLTPDFVQELLSYGARITVLSPPELKAMMITELQNSLNKYKQ